MTTRASTSTAASAAAVIPTVTDLRAGDLLLHLGEVGFAQLRDPAAPAVLVCQSPQASEHRDQPVALPTSTGVLYARADTPVTFVRPRVVTPATVLLISRRSSLHADLLALGVPVQRRSPLSDAPATSRVTAAEWRSAPLVVIDGHLSQQTLRALRDRVDLTERAQVVMVGNDPDDARIYARQAVARASMLAVLPYDAAGLRDLFTAATAPAALPG